MTKPEQFTLGPFIGTILAVIFGTAAALHVLAPEPKPKPESAPPSPSSLAEMQAQFDAVDPDIKVVFIDPEKLPAATPDSDTQTKLRAGVLDDYLKKNGASLHPQMIESLAMTAGTNTTPSNMYLPRGGGALLPEMKENTACIVLPAATNIDRETYFKEIIDMKPEHTEPYGDVLLRPFLADGEMQYQSNAHEAFHCLDIYYGPLLGRMNDEQLQSPEGLVLQHKEEVFADVGGVGEAMLAGYKNVALHTADARILDTYYYGTFIASNEKNFGGERAGIEFNYSTRAVEAFENEIQKIGLDAYRAMVMADRRNLVHEITEKFSLSAAELNHVYQFNKQGGHYLESLTDGHDRSFLKTYKDSAETAYQRVFIPR